MFSYVLGLTIASDREQALNGNFEQIVLVGHLRILVSIFNPTISYDAIEQAKQ